MAEEEVGRAEWVTYVTEVPTGNREARLRGEPAVKVRMRHPTARTWREFWSIIAHDPELSNKLFALRTQHGKDRGNEIMIALATLDDRLSECLWLPNVGEVENFAPGGKPITTGKALWEARDELDSPELHMDILQTLIQKSRLREGVEDFLESASGPPVSGPPASTLDGTAVTAAANG